MGVIQDYLSPERFDAPPRPEPSVRSSRDDDRADAPATTERRTDQAPGGGNGGGNGRD